MKNIAITAITLLFTAITFAQKDGSHKFYGD